MTNAVITVTKPNLTLLRLTSSHSSFFTSHLIPTPSTSSLSFPPKRRRHVTVTSSSSATPPEIDMVRNKHGVYGPKQKKVVILWDLDIKPPRGPPYQAAMALKTLAQHFGEVVHVSAYANRHAFVHLPTWVVEQRRERKHLDILERRGDVIPAPQAYVCGRKCKANVDLTKHFKQLHEREREKKLNRMRSLKGKKRQRFKERFINGNEKYNEAAKSLIRPKVGYGLAAELRRAGVFVKTVEDKPQAADWALKRQMQHSMSSGVDWMFLVSDDSDFQDMLRKAREASLGTVVVGDVDRALGRHADVWVEWGLVEKGEVSEKDLVPKMRRSVFEDEEMEVEEAELVSEFGYGGSDELDNVVDDLVRARSQGSGGMRISAFSEGELEEEDWEEDYEGSEDGDYLSEGEDVDSDDEDGFF